MRGWVSPSCRGPRGVHAGVVNSGVVSPGSVGAAAPEMIPCSCSAFHARSRWRAAWAFVSRTSSARAVSSGGLGAEGPGWRASPTRTPANGPARFLATSPPNSVGRMLCLRALCGTATRRHAQEDTLRRARPAGVLNLLPSPARKSRSCFLRPLARSEHEKTATTASGGRREVGNVDSLELASATAAVPFAGAFAFASAATLVGLALGLQDNGNGLLKAWVATMAFILPLQCLILTAATRGLGGARALPVRLSAVRPPRGAIGKQGQDRRHTEEQIGGGHSCPRRQRL